MERRSTLLSAEALLALSLLFHPALLIAVVLFCGVLLIQGLKVPAAQLVESLRSTPWWSWLLLALVLAAVLLEALFVSQHYSLFRADMAYQSARKLHRTFGKSLLKPQGIILLLECAGLSFCSLFRRSSEGQVNRISWLAQAMAITLGMQIYAVWGAEFAYNVYSLAFAPATCFCLAYQLSIPREMILRDLDRL